MAQSYDIIASSTEAAATVRSIADIIGTTYTDEKGFNCDWFAVQNKGAIVLHVQDDNDATVADDNIEVLEDTYKLWQISNAKYDLREIFIRAAADNPTFSIEIFWG